MDKPLHSPASFCLISTPIAVVGVSDKDFGGAIYTTLKQRGYRVVAVNPNRVSFDGDTCFASLKDLPPHYKHAVIAVAPNNAQSVVEDAIAAGFTHLWFQQGKDFSQQIRLAESRGITVVSRRCILMYTEPVDGIHSFHKFLAKCVGRY
jgi:hypothetical protein